MNLKKIAIIHVILFFSILFTFSSLFYYPLPTTFFSILLIIGFFLCINIIIGTLGFILNKDSVFMKIVASSLYTYVTSFILFIFGLNFISNSNWGTNVTFAFIKKYASQLSQLESTLPIPLVIIYVLLFLFGSLIFVFYFINIGHITKPLKQLSDDVLNSKATIKQGLSLILCIFYLPILFFFHQNFQFTNTDDIWDGEPFTDLLLPYTTITSSNTLLEPISHFTNNKKNIATKPNIIIIIVDSLRADHVGAYGYERDTTPFIDKLIDTKKAIKIENAFSTCSESGCGILSTLGSVPYDEINKNNIKINNVLKEHDYDVNFILSADHSWSGLNEHYPPYDLLYDGITATNFSATDDQLVIERLEQVPNYQKPTLFYFHLMSSHSHGMRKRQFTKFKPSPSPNQWFYKLPIVRNIYKTNTALLEKNYYDNGVILTDHYIKQIYNQLSYKGYMNNSIVLITADHGEALGEHGKYGHVKSLYNEEIKIPLIIVDNKIDLYKERHFSTHIDIAPTILDRLGINIPESWKGTSLLKKKVGEYFSHHALPDRKGTMAMLMKTDDDIIYKILYQNDPFKISKIFNISKDKNEKHDLNNNDNEWIIDKFKKQVKLKKINLVNQH